MKNNSNWTTKYPPYVAKVTQPQPEPEAAELGEDEVNEALKNSLMALKNNFQIRINSVAQTIGNATVQLEVAKRPGTIGTKGVSKPFLAPMTYDLTGEKGFTGALDFVLRGGWFDNQQKQATDSNLMSQTLATSLMQSKLITTMLLRDMASGIDLQASPPLVAFYCVKTPGVNFSSLGTYIISKNAQSNSPSLNPTITGDNYDVSTDFGAHAFQVYQTIKKATIGLFNLYMRMRKAVVAKQRAGDTNETWDIADDRLPDGEKIPDGEKTFIKELGGVLNDHSLRGLADNNGLLQRAFESFLEYDDITLLDFANKYNEKPNDKPVTLFQAAQSAASSLVNSISDFDANGLQEPAYENLPENYVTDARKQITNRFPDRRDDLQEIAKQAIRMLTLHKGFEEDEKPSVLYMLDTFNEKLMNYSSAIDDPDVQPFYELSKLFKSLSNLKQDGKNVSPILNLA